jgi:hypothetical protein
VLWPNKASEITAFTATKRRVRPSMVSVPAVVFVVLFHQNLDPELDPNLDQTLD